MARTEIRRVSQGSWRFDEYAEIPYAVRGDEVLRTAENVGFVFHLPSNVEERGSWALRFGPTSTINGY